MPVSLCEWRVRIGRFVQWMREYEIIERKEKALKERTRLLKILHERLLKMKGDLEGKEDECETKTNNSSNGETDDQSGSEITNNSIPNDPLRNKCFPTQSPIQKSKTAPEIRANSKSNYTNSTFLNIYFILPSLLLFLIFFSVFSLSSSLDDFLDLLENSELPLDRENTSSWIYNWPILMVCSIFMILAYGVFFVLTYSERELQGNWPIINENKITAQCYIKENFTSNESSIKKAKTPTRTFIQGDKTPVLGAIRKKNTPVKVTIYRNKTPAKTATKGNKFPTQTTIKEDKTQTQTTIKGDNTPTQTTSKGNKTQTQTTIKEDKTQSQTTIKGVKTQYQTATTGDWSSTKTIIKGSKTPTKSTIKGNKSVTQTTIKRKKSPIQTTIKRDKSRNATTIIENKFPNQTIIERNKSPNQTAIKRNKSRTQTTIKEDKTRIKTTIKGDNTQYLTFVKRDKTPTKNTINGDKTPTQDITKENKTKNQNQRTIKGDKTSTQTNIKENTSPTQTTIKGNKNPTQTTITEDDSPTKTTNKGDKSASQTTAIGEKSPTQTTFKGEKTPTITGGESPNQTMITGNKTSIQTKTKEEKNSSRIIIKGDIIPTQSKIKADATPPTQTTVKRGNNPTQATIKMDNSRAKITINDNNSGPSIKANKTSTESNTKENKITKAESAINGNNIPMKCTSEDVDTQNESLFKDRNTATESLIKKNKIRTEFNLRENSTADKSASNVNHVSTEFTMNITPFTYNVRLNTNPSESIIRQNNPPNVCIKAENNPMESIIKEKNAQPATILRNNDQEESTIKASNTTSEFTIRGSNTQTADPPTGSTSKECTIRSGKEKIPSSLYTTTEDPILQETACPAEILLVKAGDVELNPGPLDRSRDLHEQELVNLAYDVPPSKYVELCIALGVTYTQSQVILTKHLMDITRSLIEVFCEWKNRQRDGTNYRDAIAKALRKANLDAIGGKMSKGEYLPQEPASSGSSENGKEPLTREQVARCGEDFKTFYKTRLCRIKTDPLNFNTILEFERIYTNLELLRNEMGTTRKTPLDYKDLLTTKINGKLLKRLMVEGEGGAGKTTFCSKIAWDWTNGAEQFKEFDWVLVIPLREIDTDQTIGEIAMTYLSDGNPVQPCQIDEYILTNPSKVFIIFDGLDEYDGDLVRQGTDIAKIIRSEKYKECMVLVTTRPWKADQIKCNFTFVTAYAFIAVTGFDKEHILIYINKYFSDDARAGQELIRLIESNDVIKENMAPFPIYIAMLCVLWRDSDSEKRELIQRLKTFSQLFTEIITFLKDHYVSKQYTDLNMESITQTHEQLGIYFTQIGHIAFTGVIDKKLVFDKNDFSACSVAMETCCRVGVLSQENRVVHRRDRHRNVTLPMTSSVFFPHKLFQEYIAGVYLASLFESDHESYKVKIDDLFQRRLEEFRYLLYFTASRSKDVGLDIINRLLNKRTYQGDGMLVDVTFEAYDEDVAKKVGHQTFVQQRSLEISDRMSAHTVAGYLFIMEIKAMETLILSRRSCGPMVSRDLADIISSSTSLTGLEISGTTFHEDFFGILKGKIKTAKLERLSIERMDTPDEVQSRYLARFVNDLPCLKDLTLQTNDFHECFYTELALGTGCVAESLKVSRLVTDNRFCNGILQHGFAVEKLFPKLEEWFLSTRQSVSPNFIGLLAHSSLKKLSLAVVDKDDDEDDDEYMFEDEEYHPSLVGDPPSLAQAFLSSFPGLTDLTFEDLVIGNIRCKTIILKLKQHQHLKNIRVIHCFTDEEIDPIASAINMEKRMNVKLQHDQTQKYLWCHQMSSDLVDALCHRTSVQELILTEKTQFDNAWFASMNERTVGSKIQKLTLEGLNLEGKDQSASRDLATFLCLQPCLTDLKISSHNEYGDAVPVWLHDGFYREVARLALLSKIQKLNLEGLDLGRDDPSASRDLATFLCLQPCLNDLKISSYYDKNGRVVPVRLHDEFFHEIARLASSSKIQKLTIEELDLASKDPSVSRDLATFLCLQPCLTDLKISSNGVYGRDSRVWLHDEFYHGVARLASSSKIQKLTLEGLNLERNDPSTSRDLASFLCLQPCLTDLKIITQKYGDISPLRLHDDFYHATARLASSSKIQKLTLEGLYLQSNGPSESRDLARFLCLQPCLTDLKISSYDEYGHVIPVWLHDEFYGEVASLASSSKIKKLTLEGLNLERKDPSSSRDLATFFCLQPALMDLRISTFGYGHVSPVWLRDEFYHEVARLASSSLQIQKLTLEGLTLERNDPSASRDLAQFLCLQPGLIDVTISSHDEYGHVSPVWLHDEFYREIGRLASSSKIQKLTLKELHLERNDPSASRDLAAFLCLQPCLTDLKIRSHYGYTTWLHNEFYYEIGRLASSSKIQKLTLEGLNLGKNDPSASRNLATFLCLQPCLTELDLYSGSKDEYGLRVMPIWLHDVFYLEVDRLASSSKNPFFKNNETWKTWYDEHRNVFDPQSALHPLQTTNSAAGSPTESSESESVESVESHLQEHSSQKYHAQPESFVQSHQFQLQEPQNAQQRQYNNRLSESDALSYTPQCITAPVQGLVSASLYQKQTPQEVAQIVYRPSYQEFASFPLDVPIQSEPLAQSYPSEQSVPPLDTEQKQEQHTSQAAFQSSHRSQELPTCPSSLEFSTTHSICQGYAQSAPRNMQAPLRQSSHSPQLYTQHHIPSPHFPSRGQLPPLQGEWLHTTQNRGNEGLSSFHPPQGRYYSDVFPSLEPTQSSQPWSTQAPSQTAAYSQLAQMPALQRSIPDQPPFQQCQLQSPGTKSYQLTPSTSYFPRQSHELGGQSHFSQHAQGTRPPQLINTHQASMIQIQHQTATSAGTFPSPETHHYQQHQPRQQNQGHFSQHPVQTPVSPISSKSSQTSGVPQQPYTQVINANQAMINPNQHQTATFAATRQSPETNHCYQHRQSQQLHRHFSQHPVQIPILPSSNLSLRASGGPQQPYTQVTNTHQAGMIPNQHRTATSAGTLPSHAETYHYQQHQQRQPRHISQHPAQTPVTPISYTFSQASGGPQQPYTQVTNTHQAGMIPNQHGTATSAGTLPSHAETYHYQQHEQGQPRHISQHPVQTPITPISYASLQAEGGSQQPNTHLNPRHTRYHPYPRYQHPN